MTELKIEENKKHKTIGEAFGMSEKQYDAIEEAMTKNFALKIAQENFIDHPHDKDGNCLKDKKGGDVETTKTQKLKAFLESKEFKDLKWTPKTANDYFMLGVLFVSANKMATKLIEKYMAEKVEGLMDDGLPGILGALLGGKLHGHKIEVTIKR